MTPAELLALSGCELQIDLDQLQYVFVDEVDIVCCELQIDLDQLQ